MQLSQSTEYAIHSLYYLALQGKEKLILVSEVAKAQNISESYLAKVFQILAKAGLIKSYRGAKGGYILAQDPCKISLKKIIEAVEGSSPIFICEDHKRKCSLIGECVISNVMSEAEKKMFEVLEKTTLADLLENFHHKTNSKNKKGNGSVPFWGNKRSNSDAVKKRGN